MGLGMSKPRMRGVRGMSRSETVLLEGDGIVWAPDDDGA